jgi:hypothetical protein
LTNLIERYGCVAGYLDGTFRGKKPLSRWEAAALLNACLDRITEVTDELRRLIKEFESELAVLKGRVDGLEAKVGELEATQFSTTTTLKGRATFVIGAIDASGDQLVGSYGPSFGRPTFNSDVDTTGFVNPSLDYASIFPDIDFSDAKSIKVSGLPSNSNLSASAFNLSKLDSSTQDQISQIGDQRRKVSQNYNEAYGATTFSYDLRVELNTSFTGKDLLFTRLRSGNFDNAFGGNGLNLTKLDIAENSNDNIYVDRLYYRFPIGNQFEFNIGPRARNTEFLGAKPGVYGDGRGDKILDYFSVWGAPGVYNKSTGAFGGVIWKTPYKLWGGRFSATANYVAPSGNVGGVRTDDNDFSCTSSEGGIANDCSRSSFLAQLGWTSKQFGLSAAYRYGQRGSNFRRGTDFVASNSWWLRDGDSNSVAVNAYWQPLASGWLPSISVGWGLNSLSGNNPKVGVTVDNTDGSSDFYTLDGPAVTESQSWYVGLQWDNVFWQGNAFGMAVGQPTFVTGFDCGDLSKSACSEFTNDGNYAWEWWYKFQVTDNISITPAIFYLSRPLGMNTNSINSDGSTNRDNDFSLFGGLVQATFKF